MSFYDYSGQWLAFNQDQFPYFVMDLDKTQDGSQGRAYLISQDPAHPSAVCNITIKTSKKHFSKKVTVEPFNAVHGQVLTHRQTREFFPESNLTSEVELEFERTDKDEIKLRRKGSPTLEEPTFLSRSRPPKYSYLDSETDVYSWETFREKVSSLKFHESVFRGQPEPYSLQTTFHRTNRKDLVRYLNEDVQQLHHSIAGTVQHVFNLAIPQDLGAMMSLAQHHGFPTPFLDWTYSPFVAAWFAFSQVTKRRASSYNDENVVRVYCLDRLKLTKLKQFMNLTYTLPHTSLLDALPIENNRAVPQQGILMSTNIQDIEAHLFSLGQAQDIELLKAYDMPASDAEKAMNELAMMGITRSTLMPGIDSLCMDLRGRLFA